MKEMQEKLPENFALLADSTVRLRRKSAVFVGNLSEKSAYAVRNLSFGSGGTDAQV